MCGPRWRFRSRRDFVAGVSPAGLGGVRLAAWGAGAGAPPEVSGGARSAPPDDDQALPDRAEATAEGLPPDPPAETRGPAAEPAPARPDLPGGVLFQASPAVGPVSGKLYRFALVAVLLVGVVGLVAGLVAQRYQLHAPDPGAYGAGAYLVDRWNGRVWFCDSAQRGLPVRVCAPFVLGRVAPPTAVE